MIFMKSLHHGLVVFCLLLWSAISTEGSWWLLSVPQAKEWQQIRNTKYAEEYCDSLRYLKGSQAEFCRNHPTLMPKISEGIKSAVRECQHQFRDSRWNCSTYPGSPKHHAFKPIIKSPTREAAFVHSIIAASVTYEVTKACSAGDLPDECACAINRKKRGINWGGCSDDIKFGEAISRQFFDGKLLNSTSLKSKSQIRLHNSEAGRKAVRTNDRLVCKCHGLSGACTQIVCWKAMPPLRAVSHFLKEQYDGAILVKSKKRKKKFRPKLPQHKKPTTSDLVYSQNAQTDFCKRNLNLGSYGTKDRLCNATSRANDGCSVMCCDRDFETNHVTVTYDCNCRFEWCCHLRCQTCTKVVAESRCL